MLKIQRVLFFLAFLIYCGNVFGQTAEVYQKAADGYLDDKNYQAAFDNYTKAIKKNGKDKIALSVLYCKRGESLAGLNKDDESIKDYTTAINLNPINIDAYWGRGVVYDDNGTNQLAIDDYKKAVSLITGDSANESLSVLYCNIANIQYRLRKYSDALQTDSISLVLNGQYSRGYKVKGNIHYALKNFDQAIADFTQAIFNLNAEDHSELSMLYSYRADAKRMQKKIKDALNDYSLAININANNGHAYWNRAASYNFNRDYELASNDYSRAMAFYKDDSTLSRLYEDRAKNEIGQTLFVKAIQDDSIAIALDPNNKNAYFTKADAYAQNADYSQGVMTLNKLLTLYPDNSKLQAVIYYEIANDEYFLNEFDKVIDACGKAIQLNPGFADPYFYRGKVYLKKMNNKQLATADFNKVIQLDTSKKSVGYIFSLFYIGKGEEASKMLQNNLLSTTDNAVMLSNYYNLACMYSLMNKPDEANIYLKKAIDNGYVKKYAMADDDLDNIRNTDDYKSIMAANSN